MAATAADEAANVRRVILDMQCLPAAPVNSGALVDGDILVGFARGCKRSATQRSVSNLSLLNTGSLRLVRVALRPRAAEDARAFRGEIGLQRFPRHECDIFALGVGADCVGRIVEGEAGTLARVG